MLVRQTAILAAVVGEDGVHLHAKRLVEGQHAVVEQISAAPFLDDNDRVSRMFPPCYRF